MALSSTEPAVPELHCQPFPSSAESTEPKETWSNDSVFSIQDLAHAKTLRGCGRKTIEAQLRLLRHSFLHPSHTVLHLAWTLLVTASALQNLPWPREHSALTFASTWQSVPGDSNILLAQKQVLLWAPAAPSVNWWLVREGILWCAVFAGGRTLLLGNVRRKKRGEQYLNISVHVFSCSHRTELSEHPANGAQQLTESSFLTLAPLKVKHQWNEAASSLENPALLNGYHNKEAALSCHTN